MGIYVGSYVGSQVGSWVGTVGARVGSTSMVGWDVGLITTIGSCAGSHKKHIFWKFFIFPDKSKVWDKTSYLMLFHK